ncbi:MAG: hypothetical protein LAO21_13200 [Acidobacteriia bacterium]|nr:hypothetical protein [Terriglobia bacterium]
MDFIKSGEIKTGDGRNPSQIVLREVKKGTYATHIHVLPPDGEPFFILGRYFFKMEEAVADFVQRDLELNGPSEAR